VLKTSQFVTLILDNGEKSESLEIYFHHCPSVLLSQFELEQNIVDKLSLFQSVDDVENDEDFFLVIKTNVMSLVLKL
jgi:hypothetical protein